MKALSLWQPHASAIALRLKPYETRSWECPDWLIGKPMAIHASKKQHWTLTARWVQHKLGLPPSAEPPDMLDLGMKAKCVAAVCEFEALPFGAVICLVKVVACHLVDQAFVDRLMPQAALWGDFALGRYAWEVKVFYVFEQPIPTVGRQGLFDWTIPDEWMKKAAADAGIPNLYELWKAGKSEK